MPFSLHDPVTAQLLYRVFDAAILDLGGSLAFVPVAWLALHDFRQVSFNVVEFHLFYRKVGWSEALPHDAEVMSSWFDSGQALLLIVLALGQIRDHHRRLPLRHWQHNRNHSALGRR